MFNYWLDRRVIDDITRCRWLSPSTGLETDAVSIKYLSGNEFIILKGYSNSVDTECIYSKIKNHQVGEQEWAFATYTAMIYFSDDPTYLMNHSIGLADITNYIKKFI